MIKPDQSNYGRSTSTKVAAPQCRRSSTFPRTVHESMTSQKIVGKRTKSWPVLAGSDSNLRAYPLGELQRGTKCAQVDHFDWLSDVFAVILHSTMRA